MAIVVAHPDTQHSVPAARGLKSAGLLECLCTSFSLKRPEWLGKVFRPLAPSAYRRLAQHHGHAGLSSSDLRVLPLRLAARWAPSLDRFTRSAFGHAAAGIAVRRDAGLMAFNSNAVAAFRRLEGRGLPCILDQTIAHRRWRDRVGSEELAAFPGWAVPMHAQPTPRYWVSEAEEEVARADVILCGSEFCASTMITAGVPRDKLAIVEYGADTERFSPATDPGRTKGSGTRLLFVGALVLRKGVPYLLEAVKRLQPLQPRLTLAGIVGVQQEKLRAYSACIDVRGAVLHADMPELYRSHDVYVFPSLVEGSSLSIYEALASGLPVITTPNSGSIVRDGIEGIIVPPRDAEALAAAIERLATNPELRTEMGRAARRRATEYGDWKHYGERLASTILARFPGITRTRG